MTFQIVLIDDEKELCEIFSILFSTKLVQVKTFTDHLKAIESIAENPPHLVFIDYRLVDINGVEIAERLNAKIPKILMTGEVFPVENKLFDKVIPKPYTESEVWSVIQYYVKTQEDYENNKTN